MLGLLAATKTLYKETRTVYYELLKNCELFMIGNNVLLLFKLNKLNFLKKQIFVLKNWFEVFVLIKDFWYLKINPRQKYILLHRLM